jgi:hypothetical protein
MVGVMARTVPGIAAVRMTQQASPPLPADLSPEGLADGVNRNGGGPNMRHDGISAPARPGQAITAMGCCAIWAAPTTPRNENTRTRPGAYPSQKGSRRRRQTCQRLDRTRSPTPSIRPTSCRALRSDRPHPRSVMSDPSAAVGARTLVRRCLPSFVLSSGAK